MNEMNEWKEVNIQNAYRDCFKIVHIYTFAMRLIIKHITTDILKCFLCETFTYIYKNSNCIILVFKSTESTLNADCKRQ